MRRGNGLEDGRHGTVWERTSVLGPPKMKVLVVLPPGPLWNYKRVRAGVEGQIDARSPSQEDELVGKGMISGARGNNT